MASVDWSNEEKDGSAELYIKLYPYILRDFIHRADLRNLLLSNFSQSSFSGFVDFDSNTEGIRQGLEYKDLYDSGDSLGEKIIPIIEL